MKLPGFSADASLYESKSEYGSAQFVARPVGVQPQLILWPPGIPGRDWCIPNCVCVSQVNCPCCGWNFPRSWPPTILA